MGGRSAVIHAHLLTLAMGDRTAHKKALQVVADVMNMAVPD